MLTNLKILKNVDKLENIENVDKVENIKWFAISELTIYQFFKRCYKIAF